MRQADVTGLYVAGDGDKAFEIAGDVGAGGLVDDFGDAVSCVGAELVADTVGGSGDGGRADCLPASAVPGGAVGRADQVLIVHGEVAFGAGVGGDRVEPGLPAGQGGGVAAEFIGGMVGQSV